MNREKKKVYNLGLIESEYERFLVENDWSFVFEYYLKHVFEFELNIEIEEKQSKISFIKDDFLERHSYLMTDEFKKLIIQFLRKKVEQTSILVIMRKQIGETEREKFNFKKKIEASLVDCYGRDWEERLKRDLLKKFGVIKNERSRRTSVCT